MQVHLVPVKVSIVRGGYTVEQDGGGTRVVNVTIQDLLDVICSMICNVSYALTFAFNLRKFKLRNYI